MTRGGRGLRERGASPNSCVSAPGWKGMGRGPIGGGGGTPDGRPGGNGGGGPGSSSVGLFCPSSGLRWGGGGGIGVEVSAGTVGPGAGWIGGTGREVRGGGGGTVKGGAGISTSSTSAPSSGAPLSRTSFSSGFRSLSEGNGIDYDQLDIPIHERYKVAA